MLTQVLVGVAGMILSILVLWQTRGIVRVVGNIPWAERTLGGAGTYLLIRLVAIIFTISFFLEIFGWFTPFSNFLMKGFLGFFGLG